MGSIDTRLHDLEGKVRALVTSYLHHGSLLSELEARVAALEAAVVDLLERVIPSPPGELRIFNRGPDSYTCTECGLTEHEHVHMCPPPRAGGPEPAACLCGHPAHPGHHCKVPLQPTGRQCGCRKYEPKQAAQPAPQQPLTMAEQEALYLEGRLPDPDSEEYINNLNMRLRRTP